jgi:recombinational DNA repair ATPase RecF
MKLNNTIPIIKEIKIINEGMFKSAKIQFKEGLNIIYGCNGSGKTTIINAIKVAIEEEKSNITLWKEKKFSNLSRKEKILIINTQNKCLLLDDQLERLDNNVKKEILNELSSKWDQIIMTAVFLPEISANIINTKSFKLKNEKMTKEECDEIADLTELSYELG